MNARNNDGNNVWMKEILKDKKHGWKQKLRSGKWTKEKLKKDICKKKLGIKTGEMAK